MGTKEKLKAHIEFCERNNEDMDATSWGMEEGVIISGNEAKTFLKLIEQSTSQHQTIERLRNGLKEFKKRCKYNMLNTTSKPDLKGWKENFEDCEQLLNTTEPIDPK